MNTKTDEEHVTDLNMALRALREIARQAEEAGIHVRLRTRKDGTPGVLKDTIIAATRFLTSRPEEDNDPAS